MKLGERNFRAWIFEHRYAFLLITFFYTILGVEFMKVLIGDKLSEYLVFVLLVSAGVNLMANKKARYYLTLITGVLILIPESVALFSEKSPPISYFSFGVFFLFFLFMAYELFLQLLNEKEVNERSIIAAFSGYFMIGVLAFFSYSMLQLHYPNSFNVDISRETGDFADLLYFSFVSLTTIGFGDITPTHSTAKHFVVFFGLIGQFYLAVIVAIMVGKYLAQNNRTQLKNE